MPRKLEHSCETEKRIFPTRLRELMQECKTTQRELARAIGMRPQTVSLYATGQSNPDIDGLKKIAEFFDVSADWLLGLSDKRSSDIDIRKIADILGLSDLAVQTLQGMAAPDNLGGDPEVLFALNAMLEAMGSRDEPGEFILVDITNYLIFKPIADEKFTDKLENISNVPRETLSRITNEALKAELLQEIGKSLDEIKAEYFK